MNTLTNLTIALVLILTLGSMGLVLNECAGSQQAIYLAIK